MQGSSYRERADLDPMLTAEYITAVRDAYAGDASLHSPLLSPLFGDFEGTYSRFKTLGAKRYMVEEEDALTVGGKSYPVSLTVSGVNKKSAVPWLLETYGQDGIFEAFTNYLAIPPQATGKNIHTYIDYEQQGILTDYRGEECEFHELSGVHLEATGYSLSLSVMYLNFLMGIKFKD